MIVVSDFTELAGDPRYGGVNATDFGASKFCFDVDTAAKLVAVWGDEDGGDEPDFKLYGFQHELKFSLAEPIIYAKFEPRARQIWLARRDSEEQISILIYGYDGEFRANLALPDELGDSSVWMDELPEMGGMAVGLGAGQDGSRSFLLHADESELNLTIELEDDFGFLFVLFETEGENTKREQAFKRESEQRQTRKQSAECELAYMQKGKASGESKDRQKGLLDSELKRVFDLDGERLQTRRQSAKQENGQACEQCTREPERESEQMCENEQNGKQPHNPKNSGAREAVLLNLYEQEIVVVSYPQLEPLRKFRFPDEIALDGETREFMLGGIAPLSDQIWLVRDDGYFRHYLFDAREFKFIAEIALAGFEPRVDSAGEITSQICDIDYLGGRLVFTRYELGEQDRYFEADAAEVLARANLRVNLRA